ncbi:hypothetical protein GCM10022287_18710 [Gryllotalpicola koreensis]|uniref:Uncharacterized protein n=1 Tax=Gryllotalpicola koreensis TaxID=993086 RepID=A0ABP8A088_9MICO
MRLAAPPIAVAWAAASALFTGFIVAVAVMFAVVHPSGAHPQDPVTAIDDALGVVARDSGALAPAFAAVPALIALVHLAALVLAAAVIVRPRVGAIGRLAAGLALTAIAAAAARFWGGLVRSPALPGPDVVAWVTVFLVPTVLVLALLLAAQAPHGARGARASDTSAQRKARHA